MRIFTEKRNTLVWEFEFKNFVQALDFVNLVWNIAEMSKHHPDILIHDYKFVTITSTTHDTWNTITDKDLNLVKQIESFYNS
jgi:4a-hydroxytetrahydrobiopterin dehydratase